VRADLPHYYPGYSLGDLFSGRVTPDELWDLVAHLPRTSAVMSALADDPEIPAGAPRPPSMREFSPETEALADVADKLAALLVNVIALGGGKPPRLQPYPRPGDDRRKAAEQERHAERIRKHRELVARVTRRR
jgi:hypothetical protein